MIRCESISKTFQRHTGQKLIRQYVQQWFSKSPKDNELFYALKDVTFNVRKGESVAIVGRNGAGKSTLLSVIAGLCQPDAGHVTVNGRVAALMELGSGFHPDLTGAENVRLNAALLGFTKKETEDYFSRIAEFAGIGDFMDEPLRTYSSGMIIRLAFAVTVNLKPDILIIDEILAVGDHAFQQKCFERIHELRRAGTTFLFVTHALALTAGICDRAIWLDEGQLMLQGKLDTVMQAYHNGLTVGVAV